MLRSPYNPLTYIESRLRSRRMAPVTSCLESFVMFIGYPRSGHSLIGSLLNAHRNMLVAHELDSFHYCRLGYDRNQIFWLLWDRDRRFAARGRRWSGYDYAVPNQWQGRTDTLRVIGDKKGGVTTARLGRRPRLLDDFSKTIGLPLRIIHVVRNPYDNIATISRKHRMSLRHAARYYSSLCRTNATLIEGHAPDIHSVNLERFISDPQSSLRDVCRFLGVGADPGYLEDCAKAVFEVPRRTRDQVSWPNDVRGEIARLSADVPFLSGYEIDA